MTAPETHSWSINGRGQDDSFVFRSGLKMQVSPEGDCMEATFVAKGQGLGLRPLDIVTIACDGQTLFTGELRVGGNPNDVNGHQHTVRSLVLRLKEVNLPKGWSAPKQNAATTVQSLMQSVLPQLGGAFSIGSISLSFESRAIRNANQQTAYALLEQIAEDGAAQGVDVKFGVNAQRQFFCVAANTGGMSMPAEVTAATRWEAPVAETPCTAVLWYIAKTPDGDWLTHESRAPEVGTYGVRSKSRSIKNNEGLWKKGAHSITVNDGSTSLTDDSGMKAALTDGWSNHISGNSDVPGSTGAAITVLAASDSADIFLEQTLSAGADYLAFDVDWTNGDIAKNRVVVSRPNQAQQIFSAKDTKRQKNVSIVPEDQGGGMLPVINGTAYIELFELPAGTTVRFEGGSLATAIEGQRRVRMQVYESRPELIDRALLDNLAKYHYDLPHLSAADIEVKGIFPASAGQMDGTNIAAYEYRITADRGVTTGILLGQAGDPDKLAAAALIKARDNRATIDALISKE